MKDATLIALVLDRSGSILQCLESMQSALDEFVEKQKKEPGECELALFQFDDQYEQVYRKQIQDAPKHEIIPRGMTALQDAIGRTITTIGEELGKRPESERPEKVMICIITDGFENASREFTRHKVAKMIKHQTEKYNWVFVFLGANQDAVLTASTYGIGAANALSFAATSAGIASSNASVSSYTSSLRSASMTDLWKFSNYDSSVGFTDEQREAALDQDNQNQNTAKTTP